MRTLTILVVAVTLGWLAGPAVCAAEDEKEKAELAKAVNGVKLALGKGLAASERAGKPISGKYELEHGALQLSVYTMKDDTFSEVIVDHKTGKIAKVEPITTGDDYAAAKAQREAMAKAKVSLRAAADKAVKANKGYHTVSVMPELKDGHPVANVTLVKGNEWKTVAEKLE